jgi:hypothetical protein
VLAPYVIALSVLHSKVVPSLVTIEELTGSPLSDTEVDRNMAELECGVSEALGISLSEVQAQYFQGNISSQDSDSMLQDKQDHLQCKGK